MLTLPRFLIAMIIIVIFIFPYISYAHFTASAAGTCRDFDVSITTDEPGCYDVKIDAAGQALHKDGWKSSFFYVENALCDGSGAIKVRFSETKNFTTAVKLRQNNTISEVPLEISQQCPAGEGFVAFAIGIALLLAAGILIYARMR